MNTSYSYDEVDLLDLTIKIYLFFKRRFWLIAAVVTSCISIGILSSYLLFQPRYQTTMIFQSRSMTASEVIGVIDALNSLVKEENYTEIEKLTGIPSNIAYKIAKLEAMPNRDLQKNLEKDTRKDSTMALILETTSNDHLEIIQQGLVNCLENLPYVQKHKKLFKEASERILEQIYREIKHLDSLKKIAESSFYNKNSFILNTSGDISEKIILLREKENKVRMQLAFLDDIKVIKGFTRYNKPRKFSIQDNIGISTFVGVILGILLALIIELNKLIREKKNKIDYP